MESVISVFENADPFKSWWPILVAVGIGIAIVVRTIMGGQRCPNDNDISDQIVIVTGGNSGIGFEVAKALAARGGRIILACRNLAAGERSAAIIKRELRCQAISNCFVEARYLDLTSFDCVKRFALAIMSEFDHIDVLVNNAGIIFAPASASPTSDGYDVHLQVNFLAPFLLTQLLLPHLQTAINGRVINVTAHAHAAAKIDFDDPLNVGTWAQKFHARDAFAHSKLAVILGTIWQARELKDTAITVNCCTPGLVRGTGHLRFSPLMSSICIKCMTFPWMWLFMKNAFEGAQCIIRLATDPKLKQITGQYFNDCEIVSCSPIGQDKDLAKKLIQQSRKALQKFLNNQKELK